MTSASRMAVSAVSRMARCNAYCGLSSPGVSRITIWASPVVWIPTTRSRVDCGLGLVMLSFWPTMRLRSVDFPTVGFPATVTIPARGMKEDTPDCELRAHYELRNHYELRTNC